MRKTLLYLSLIMLAYTGCSKQPSAPKQKAYTVVKKAAVAQEAGKPQKQKMATVKKNHLPEELDFQVKNNTGKTTYAVCFSYIQKEAFSRWRWDKSAIYKIEPNETTIINIDTIPDAENREYLFGYLTLFDNEQDAHDAIYELTPDSRKIDLDKLYNLKNKTVLLKIEKYGIKKDILDFEVVKHLEKKTKHELDFVVVNETGKAVFVTGFIYQVEDNIRSVWKYDKTPVQRLEPGDHAVINVDTVKEARDRGYIIGYLGVFEAHQEQLAHEATYELLQPKNRISVGRLSRLKGHKVAIQIEQYGAVGEITEFDIQPATSVMERLHVS